MDSGNEGLFHGKEAVEGFGAGMKHCIMENPKADQTGFTFLQELAQCAFPEVIGL